MKYLCKNKQKTLMKVIATILVIATVFTGISWDSVIALAAENNSSETANNETIVSDLTDAELDDYIIELEESGEEYEEVESERTLNSTTYELTDNIKKLVQYSENVRFEDEDGNLVDYDPTLKEVGEDTSLSKDDADKYSYENKEGDMKNYFPEDLSQETPILLNNNDYSISVAPVEESLEDLQEAETVIEEVTDLYDNKEKAQTGVTYSTEDENVDLTYESMSTGVKEDMVFNEVPETNVYQFELKLDGITAKKDECCEGISFYKKGTDDIVGGIAIPFMNDATGNAYSEDITYDLKEKEDGVYILTMTIDEDYLNSEDRVYPVTVDPTVSWAGSSKTGDVYTVSGETYGDTNFYSNNVTLMRVGASSFGSSRTYMNFPSLSSTIDDCYVSSATLSLYETGTGSSGNKFYAYRNVQNWSKSTLTWNTRPNFDTTALATGTSTGKQGGKVALNVKTYAQYVANYGVDYGIMLKNAYETTTSKYLGFYSSRYTANTSYRPKLEIVYCQRPAQASSITASSSYIKPGNAITFTWAGVTSPNTTLSYINYRTCKYSLSKGKDGDAITSYSSSTKIGTTSNGSKAVSEIKNYAEGEYAIYIKGVDAAGISGMGKGKCFVVDGTAPKLTSVSASPTTSSESYKGTVPTITWSGATDSYLRRVEYSVNGSTYVSLGTTASGSSKLDTSLFTGAGLYNISVRAIDRAGNTSAVKTIKYYYDPAVPEIGSTKLVLRDTSGTPTVYLNNITCGLSGLSSEVRYDIVASGKEDITDETKLTKKATVNFDASGNGSFALDSEDLALTDGVYKIFVAVKDRAANYSKVTEIGYYKFSDVEYDATASLSASYDEDNKNIKIEWDEDTTIQSVALYTRNEEGEFVYDQTLTSGTSTTKDVTTIQNKVDYRAIVTYTDGTKKLTNVSTISKSETSEDTENTAVISDETTTTTKVEYSSDSIDTDNDGLEDAYEIWELNTNKDNTDSDADGFSDTYEVFILGTDPVLTTADTDSDADGLTNKEEAEKGTDPYRIDSDFDGIADNTDSESLKTDLSQKNTLYTTDVHIGLYDRKVTDTEDKATASYVQNIYSGSTKQSTDSAGNVTAYYYDSNNNNTAVVGYVDKEYIANTYTYDTNSNMTYITHNGFGYDFEYDSNSNLKDISVGSRSLVAYDYQEVASEETEESTEETEESTEETTEEKTPTYIQTGMNYGNGDKYSYTYDSKNENITGITINGTLSYTMTYDSDGHMLTQEDKVNGVTYTYTYDSDGNTQSISGSNGFNISYASSEETTDNVTTTKSSTTYSAEDLKRVCSSTSTTDESAETTSTTTVLIDGNKMSYVMNSKKEKENMSITNADGTTVVSMAVTTAEDGTTTLTNKNGDKLVYSYDVNDNITSITQNGEEIASYEYDGLQQVTRENDKTGNKTVLYTYDKGGNITSVKTYAYTTEAVSGEPTSIKTYEYGDSEWKDLLTSYNGQTLTYDEIGNPLQYRDDMNFTWTDGRSLETITKGEDTISYKYNKDGIRTEKTINGVTTSYTLENNNIVKETKGEQTIWYIYDGDGELVGFEVNGVSYYYEKNLQGDITAIYNESGEEVAGYTYDAWGNVTNITGDTEIANLNPYRYRGYYQDDETEFYYLQSRYYDTEVGRFINADSTYYLALTKKINENNMFEYCGNNIVNVIDKYGNVPYVVIKFIIGAVSGAIGYIFQLKARYFYMSNKKIMKKKFSKKDCLACMILGGAASVFGSYTSWVVKHFEGYAAKLLYLVGSGIMASIVWMFTKKIYSYKRLVVH